ncbi:MAG: PaaI family thioesterase [Deltaproteobacteria bacterium]|nr:PaaI family thioesterase [Deltaproteobacteria bacterium]
MSDTPRAPAELDLGDSGVVRRIAEAIATLVPHNRELGIRLVECDGDSVTLALPYSPRLVGNPATGVLHGGAITTLLDGASGTAVFVALRAPIPVATLDLRIDYLRPATPGVEVHARARCTKVTKNVAFVRCEAYHPEQVDDLVAVASGTFVIFRGSSLGGRGKTP